jgi:hypothetical protein
MEIQPNMMACACNSRHTRNRSRRITTFESSPEEWEKRYLQNNTQNKRARGMDEVVEHFPSMCEALDSITSTSKFTNNKKMEIRTHSKIGTKLSRI